MKTPAPGVWFIANDDDVVCQMTGQNHFDAYYRGSSGAPMRNLMYVSGSKFSAKRLATLEEIKDLSVCPLKQIKKEFTISVPIDTPPQHVLKHLEKEYITKVYNDCRYNQSKAALLLGLSRGGLRLKLKEYDLLKG